jgi:hypothetical protein
MEPPMTLPAPHTHHVFVDFENVPSVNLALVAELPVLVTLLIGRTQSKVDTGLLEQVHRHAAKVRVIRLQASGRNALDLTLAYYVGRAVIEHDGVELHVVSKDKDFDPLITHLRDNGISVARAESFAALPFLAPAKPAPARRSAPGLKKKISPAAKPDARLAKITARLGNPQNANRPATERALRAYLRTALGKEVTDDKIESSLLRLRQDRVLTIDTEGKVTYPDSSAR